MSSNSKIEWTHHTYNPWWGCHKVSPACAFCYAERDAHRYGHEVWGDDAPRRFFGDKHWNEPLKWNKAAAAAGERHRVFCASMADVFEDREDLIPHRARLLKLIEATPHLDWLLLTKRPENIVRHVGQAITLEQVRGDNAQRITEQWLAAHRNVWLGITAEDQTWFDRRWAHLCEIRRAACFFISAEPLLGKLILPEDFLLPNFSEDDERYTARWVITGGESGPKARPGHPDWYRALRDQCDDNGVPFLFKQWGEWLPYDIDAQPPFWSSSADGSVIDGHALPDGIADGEPVNGWLSGDLASDDDQVIYHRVGKKEAGRLLDGREWNEFPTPNLHLAGQE